MSRRHGTGYVINRQTDAAEPSFIATTTE